MTKPTKWHMRLAKTQISLGGDSDQPGHPPGLIRVFAVRSWVAKGLSFLHADSEDSDQTGRKLRSAWASALSDQSWLCAQWVAKGLSFLHADSQDSDQTGRMPRLF